MPTGVGDDSDGHVKMHLRYLHWLSLLHLIRGERRLHRVTSWPIRIDVEMLNDRPRLDRGTDGEDDDDARIDRRATMSVVLFYILILRTSRRTGY